MLEDDVELAASASEDEAVALSKLLNWFGSATFASTR